MLSILSFHSEMFALQSIVQQQGPHPQIFLPPRAPHQQMMQKVCFSHSQFLLSINRLFCRLFSHVQYLQSVPPAMAGIATPPNKRGRSPSPTAQGFYKSNNPPYSQSPSEFKCLPNAIDGIFIFCIFSSKNRPYLFLHIFDSQNFQMPKRIATEHWLNYVM